MSTYIKQKVIRLPFPQNLLTKINTKDVWDCEDYLKEKFGDLWGTKIGCFDISCTEDAYYIDYIVDEEYGVNAGEWGFAWYLTEEDINKYKPLFDKGEFEYNINDLRKVAYCWYNCSEPPDYYNPIMFEDI